MDKIFLTYDELKNLKNLYVQKIILNYKENAPSFKEFKRSFGISGNFSCRILDKKKWFLEKIKNGL